MQVDDSCRYRHGRWLDAQKYHRSPGWPCGLDKHWIQILGRG